MLLAIRYRYERGTRWFLGGNYCTQPCLSITSSQYWLRNDRRGYWSVFTPDSQGAPSFQNQLREATGHSPQAVEKQVFLYRSRQLLPLVTSVLVMDFAHWGRSHQLFGCLTDGLTIARDDLSESTRGARRHNTFVTRILYMDTGDRCATRENRFYQCEILCVRRLITILAVHTCACQNPLTALLLIV